MHGIGTRCGYHMDCSTIVYSAVQIRYLGNSKNRDVLIAAPNTTHEGDRPYNEALDREYYIQKLQYVVIFSVLFFKGEIYNVEEQGIEYRGMPCQRTFSFF